MSKKLTQKVIEAGIIPAHAVKLLKHWRCVDEDLPDGAAEVTQQQLLEFVDEIAELLEVESEIPEIRETDLTLRKQLEHSDKRCTAENIPDDVFSCPAVMDAAGYLVISWVHSDRIYVGCFVHYDGKCYRIQEISLVYSGEEPEFLRMVVEEVEDAEVPRLLEADKK